MATNKPDVVSLDVPLLIRLLEYAREDAKTDMDLHDLTEKLISKSVEGKTLTMSDYNALVGVKSSFASRAASVDRSALALQTNVYIEELARDPTLRSLGWHISVKPLNAVAPRKTLGNGDWYSNTPVTVDKSVREKTDRALYKLGWNRCMSNKTRLWSYQKSVGGSPVFLALTWALGARVPTSDHPLGKNAYPIKYMEIFVDDGLV